MAKNHPQPPPPRNCDHRGKGETPEPYTQDGKTGYHYRCNGCQIILRTQEPPR